MLRYMITLVYLATLGMAGALAFALPAPASEVKSSVSERSIYLLDSLWTNDAGRNIKLADLSGQYQILGFIFTRCGATCPMLVKSMQTHLRSLPQKVRGRTRLVLVTIDPAHDTPSVLQQYRQDMDLTAGEWTLLNGSAASVRELTAVVGFNYDGSENAAFVHSNMLTLLDPQGEVILQQPAASDWSVIAEKVIALETGRDTSEGRCSSADRTPCVAMNHSQENS